MEPTKPIDPDEIELRPDGWERFRAAVHAAAKSGPKPHEPKAKSVVVKKARKD